MSNIIEFATVSQADKCAKDLHAYKVIVDCNDIITEKDWLRVMAEKFHFPVFLKEDKRMIDWFEGAYGDTSDNYINWNEYEDWITDLSWIEETSIVLILFNYKNFLVDNIDSRNYIYNNLKNVVLPWWDTEVKKYMINGKTKEFKVFLIH